jgi:prepilin-type N-terminal cleavage/methylation domain-containing protein
MKKAFTLIELLVVIAIIAILAAILFPVFAQAKLAAKKTQSLSNIKQTMLAELMYTNDYDDVYSYACPQSWWYPTEGGWAYSIYPYEKNLDILRDPTDPNSKTSVWCPSWEFPPDNPGVVVSYVSNGFLYQDSGTYATHMYGIAGMDQSWMASTTTNTTSVTKPAETISFAVSFGRSDLWGTNDVLSGVNWWDYNNGGPGMIPNGNPGTTTPYSAQNGTGTEQVVNQDPRNGAVAATYSGNTTPFAFSDGHAKSMQPYATNPNPTGTNINQPWQNSTIAAGNGHDPLNMWDAYR